MAIWRATLNFLFSIDSAHPTATDLEAVATLANTSATVGDGSAIGLSTNEGDSATGLLRAKVFAKRAGTGGAGEMSLSTRNTSGNMVEAVNISTGQAVTCTSPTGGLGYGTGAGGAVTQATSITTGVTLDKVCGTITTVSAVLLTVTNATFTLTNSAIAATDSVVVSVKSYGGTAGGIPVAFVTATAAGSCAITIRNIGAVTLDAVVVLTFSVVKAVAA